MFAIPFFLAARSTVGWHPLAHVLAWVCVIPGLVFGYVAAVQYIPLGRRALAEGRLGSATVADDGGASAVRGAGGAVR
jgi:hypothetical protein